MKIDSYRVDMRTGHVILCDRNKKEYDVNTSFDVLRNSVKPALAGWRSEEDYFLIGYRVVSSDVKEIDINRDDAGKVSSVRFVLEAPIKFKYDEYCNNDALTSVLRSVLGVNVESVDNKYAWGRVFCNLELEPSEKSRCLKDVLLICKSIEIRYD